MTLHAATAATATLIAVAFGLCTLERWIDRRRSHEGAWTAALFLFAAGAAALWVGAGLGWNEWSFRAFYLFGAILNVPVLALGTVYLLAGASAGRRAALAVGAFSFFAAGILLVAPIDTTAILSDQLPQGSEVFGALPRILAAVASGGGATVVFAGSAMSLWRRRRMLTNSLIALGTIVLSAGGLLNSVVDEMDAFAYSLVVGITIIFAGFLAANDRPRATLRAVQDEAESA